MKMSTHGKEIRGMVLYIGKMDRGRLDRNEGYEVLDFANTWFQDSVTIDDLHKFEKMLKNDVPSKEVMKADIIVFKRNNW